MNLGTSVGAFAMMVLGSIATAEALKAAEENLDLPGMEVHMLRTVWLAFIVIVFLPSFFYWKNRDMRQRVFQRWMPKWCCRT